MDGYLPDVCVDLGTRLRKYKQYVAEEVLARVQRRTPVRSGKLKNSWGFLIKQEGFEIYNVAEYAAYVNNGTDKQRGQFMLETTLAEIQEIMEIAAQRAGLK